MLKMFVSILLNIALFSISYCYSYNQNEQCTKISCGHTSLPDKKCVKMLNEHSALLQGCSSPMICKLKTDEIIGDAICFEPPKPDLKGLPGMKCDNYMECFSKQCEGEGASKSCKGIELDQPCTIATLDLCNQGLTCLPSNADPAITVCSQPLNEGETCSSDYDCKMTHGCFHRKCTPYFSLEDGTIIDEPIESPFFSFCKSGYSDSKGKCVSLHLEGKNVKCDNAHPCRYNDDIVLPDNCKCGYNADGDKYCLIGSGDYNYTRYIDYLKDYYFNKGNCHLHERGGDGCLKDVIEGDASIKETLKKLYNFKLWALYNNKMIKPAGQCVFDTEIPQYDPSKDEPEEQPEIAKCATYKCQEKASSCAQSKYTSISKIEVVLSNTCQESNYCSLGGKPNDIFYQNKDVTGECKSKDTPSEPKRYPGEDCMQDSDCLNPKSQPFLGKCVDKKCIGLKEGEVCTVSESCLAGLYCNILLGKCMPQLDLNKECKSSFDCKNKFLCYEGKCQDIMYSQETGTILDKADPKTYQYYCEFGRVYEKTCVKYVERNKFSKNKYTPCDIGTQCEYQYEPASFGILNKDCGCGYNEKGQGYCPLGQETDESGWKSYYKTLKQQYDNTCHSVNRFNCHIMNSNTQNDLSKYINRVLDGHLFHNSVACAEKVLNSHRLSLSLITLITMTLLSMI